MKTYQEFIKEAFKRTGKTIQFLRVYHGTSKDNADKIKQGGFKGETSGVYGPGVYTSTSKWVARRYSKEEGGGKQNPMDSGVVSTLIPKSKVKTIRTPETQSTEPRVKSQELRAKGQPAVRIKNAATGHETGPYSHEADYVVVDPKVASKNVEKTSRVFRPTKRQARNTDRALVGNAAFHNYTRDEFPNNPRRPFKPYGGVKRTY